ncbi:hypothetical protein ACE38W_00415 [Chitinophaga sp. Hz27]|uniref:hypothetical protein n=1 Tax=Chitinophaga sp. Hz27 TaxID=3347169 RepID=UPI0035DF1491
MALKNFYPEKPVLPYQRTKVEMPAVVVEMKTRNVPAPVLHSAYIMFRNESANGSKGINNNPIGIQADAKRWPKQFDDLIAGTVYMNENGTGKPRIFLALNRWEDSITILLNRVQDRGLFVGGFESLVTKKNVLDQISLKDAYQRNYIVWPKSGQRWKGRLLTANYKPTPVDEKEALQGVNLAVAYYRSWAKGDAAAWPTPQEAQNLLSMYRQALTIFQ